MLVEDPSLAMGSQLHRRNMFIYYATDDTRMGSLYWSIAGSLIQYRMPLDSITAVYIGKNGPFWPTIPNNNELVTPEVSSSLPESF